MTRLSCGFPPSRDLPAYAQRAESLGYERVWVYDSPALYGDVWVALARIVEATERIGVATGVAVPILRHPVVTASAIATVEDLAPGRVAVAFGTGFTARLAMGKRAMRWADLARYLETVRALLRGEVVDVEGAKAQLIYPPGFGPELPIDVPLYVAVAGPKGFGVAHEVADGVVLGGLPPAEERDARWSTVAMRWADLARYVETVRGLLRGEVVDVEGAKAQLIYPPGFGPERPIDVPLYVAVAGPKGFGVAHEIADGVVLGGLPPAEERDARWSTVAMLVNGTVLDPDEDETSERVRAAVGPWFVTRYHAIYEWAPDALEGMAGGAEWRAQVEGERPEGERHLAVHDGHVVTVTDRDRPLLDAAGPALLEAGWTGDPERVHARLRTVEAAGVTEVIYTPVGPDIARELEAFASAAAGDG